MDKQKAIERVRYVEEKIELARAEVQELRKIIDTPEPAGSLLTKPEPGSDRKYWVLGSDSSGGLFALHYGARASVPLAYVGGAIFQSGELAVAHADAINTMLLLRHQPGSEEATGMMQFLIEVIGAAGCLEVRTMARSDRAAKMNKLSPCFVTRDAAEQALQIVGADRVLTMFKTLHHVGG